MYTHFYGFSDEPFSDAPNPKFLFLIPGHERTLNCLLQGIERKSGWILVSGDAGSGKTLLIHHLLNSFSEIPKVKTVHLFQTRISFDDLLKGVLSELNLPPDAPSGVLQRKHFQNCLTQNFTPEDMLLLFFDEAHDFSTEVFEEIYKFFATELNAPGNVQLIFFGQPAVEEKLQAQPLHHLNHKIAIRCPIKPFSKPESQRYIDHRLRLVGGNSKVFTPEALNLITRYGEGIPRTINIICDNSFRIGHQLSEPKITADIVQKALREMYVQKGSPHFSSKLEGRLLSKKILYPLAALICLVFLIWMGNNHLHWHHRPVDAKLEDTAVKAEKQIPVLQAKQSEGSSPKKATPVPSINQTAIAESVQTAQPDSAASPGIKREDRILKIITVREGATLNSLCLENYGLADITLLDHIMRLNPRITNPHLILVNERIKLPEINDHSFLITASDGTIKIYLGTFGYPDAAILFKEEAILEGKEISVTRQKISTRETWYRLTAGNFKTQEEARRTISTLKTKGLLPSLVSASQRTAPKS
jgi:general secretion pathway protein A